MSGSPFQFGLNPRDTRVILETSAPLTSEQDDTLRRARRHGFTIQEHSLDAARGVKR